MSNRDRDCWNSKEDNEFWIGIRMVRWYQNNQKRSHCIDSSPRNGVDSMDNGDLHRTDQYTTIPESVQIGSDLLYMDLESNGKYIFSRNDTIRYNDFLCAQSYTIRAPKISTRIIMLISHKIQLIDFDWIGLK